jgi:hypothetical protein
MNRIQELSRRILQDAGQLRPEGGLHDARTRIQRRSAESRRIQASSKPSRNSATLRPSDSRA